MNKDAIEKLESQGCFADDWSLVEISDKTDLCRIRNVYFSGPAAIGANTEIINVPGGISNVRIGDNVKIVNVARIENAPTSRFGVGTDVAVLDETGSRTVRIYPGISAQIATIAARMPEYAKTTLIPMIDKHIAQLRDMQEIGDGAEIIDCGPLIDTRIWPGVKVEGAAWLRNGSIVSNQESRVKNQVSVSKGQGPRVKNQVESLAYVGQGVNAENFIIEDASVANGVTLRNTYVGQGCVLDKGFTSHDSLFFANCAMENGEACAVLAGPYSVSMHKSSLLIGCQTAFMNAGSGTNMSNHMYKLGPVHWGVLERGVKTSSNSYLMHGSRVGAYSLVMGEHKSHPDTSDFPFSYLFGDGKGNTIVVPGAMLRSFGLKRDATKWPKRDRRLNKTTKQNDKISFKILNPQMAERILKAIEIIDELLADNTEEVEKITYKGLSISRKSLEKGRKLYQLALFKYLQRLGEISLDGVDVSESDSGQWIDLLGMVIPEFRLQEILSSASIVEMESGFDKALESYAKDETAWVAQRLKDYIKDENRAVRAAEFDAIVDKDYSVSVDRIDTEKAMLSFL